MMYVDVFSREILFKSFQGRGEMSLGFSYRIAYSVSLYDHITYVELKRLKLL